MDVVFGHVIWIVLSLGVTAPPETPTAEEGRSISRAAAFPMTEARPEQPEGPDPAVTDPFSVPTPTESAAPKERPQKRPTAPPRFTGVGLIVASAISGGAVIAGSAYTMHAILSCDDTTFADEPCTERAYVASIAFLIGHKIVADLGAGLAAGAGWHWSRWRHYQGRQRDRRRYRDTAFWGATVFGLGVASEIIGVGLLAHLNWGERPEAENEDQLPVAIVAVLGSGALLRIIGAGLATFGWGGEKWLRSDSGRASSLSTSRHPPGPRHHRL